MGEGDVSVESSNSDGSSTRTDPSLSETTSPNEPLVPFYLDESNTQGILNQGSPPDASRQESPRPVDTDGSGPLDTPATPGNASIPAGDDTAGRREPAPATPGKEESIPPVSLFKDTPHKPYTSHPDELECGFGEYERTAIRTDIGNQVPVMSNDHLFGKVLPPLRRCFTIDKICDTLKEEGILVGDEEKGFSWKGLENTKRGDKENEVYNGPLTEIFNMLVKAADKLLEEQKELDDMLTGPMSPLTSLPSSQNTDSRTPPNEVKEEENSLHDPSSSPLPILTPSPTPSHTSLQTPSDVDPCTPSPTSSQSNPQDDSQTLGSVRNPLQKSTVVFRAEGTKEFYPSKFKPDGTLYLRDPKETLKIDGKEKILLYNSAVPFVFKLTESTKHFEGNLRQILHYMVLTTYLDFCRRFTFGIQINDTKLRVWFRSRSIVLVSDDFDINKDYKDIIKIFLSLLYASKEELGWDTSITTSLKEKPKEKRKRKGRHKGEGEDSIRYYSMEIDGREITTDSDSVISEFKAKGLIGSGARIYKARLTTNKKDVVLKDFWLLDGRDPEPKIRDQIKSAITKDDDKSFADSHILKPIAHGDVQVNGENDHTEKIQLRGQSLDMSKQFDIPLPDKEGGVKASTLGSKGTQNHARRIAVELERNRRTEYPHRSHYRIVFEEVATPFDKIDNIKDILLVLIDVLHTLRRVHAAGWVHRDISIGNVYLYKDPVTQEKKGMIGDFEYAKNAGIGAQNDVRTGTPDFMPVEIAKQRRLYNQRCTNIDTDADSDSDDSEQEVANRNKESETAGAPMGVYYNYVHDLESVWWIAVWALFNFEKKHAGSDEIDSWAAEQRKLHERKLFSGIVCNMARFDFFLEPDNYKEATKWLPKYFKSFITNLDSMANAIAKFYRKKVLKKIDRIVWDESSTIHDKFIRLLRRVETEEYEIVRVPGIDDEIVHTPGIDDEIPPATRSNKRRTDEQGSERSNKRQRSTLETASR